MLRSNSFSAAYLVISGKSALATFMEKLLGKRLLRPKKRWKDNTEFSERRLIEREGSF
jgi:hypothetical protein